MNVEYDAGRMLYRLAIDGSVRNVPYWFCQQTPRLAMWRVSLSRDELPNVRVVNQREQCIGYRLNIIGVRVYRDYCQLSAKSGDDWLTIGPGKALPVLVPADPAHLGTDPLLLTAFQYHEQNPGSDLYDVLAQRKNFDEALNQDFTAAAR